MSYLMEVLNGKSFLDLSREVGKSPVAVRTAFLREVRRMAPELWEEGRKAGHRGSYATPSVDWLRKNRGRILAAPGLAARKEVSAEIEAAIILLEAAGYAAELKTKEITGKSLEPKQTIAECMSDRRRRSGYFGSLQEPKWALSEILKLTDVAAIHALARSVLDKT